MSEIADFWTAESQVYPGLDATFMRGETTCTLGQKTGKRTFSKITVSSKVGMPVSLHHPFNSEQVDFTAHFQFGRQKVLRIDNQAKSGTLHCHLTTESKSFEEHIPLRECGTVAELISRAFEQVKEVYISKYPQVKVSDGPGFVGCK